MREIFKYNLYLLFCAGIISGCSSVRDLKIEKSVISGPVSQLPVHIVRQLDSSMMDLSLSIGYNKSEQIPIQNNYNIENSYWEKPEFLLDAHLDYKLKERLAIFAGLDYSYTKNSILTGGILGVGIFDTVSNFATRFDLGIKINTMHRNANYSYWRESSYGGRYLERDSVNRENSTWDGFASITINTVEPDRIINPFLRIAYIHQNILKLVVGPWPGDDVISLNVNNLLFSLGMSIGVFRNTYIVTGVNYNLVYLPNYVKPLSNFMPFIRFHYEFKPPSKIDM